MRNHSSTTSTNADSFRRVEVITGVGRRRRWTDEEKARIVAESLDPATTVLGGGAALRAAREPAVRLAAAAAAERISAATSAGRRSCRCCWQRTAPAPAEAAGRMEIALGPAVVRVGADVDAAALRRVLEVVRGLA